MRNMCRREQRNVAESSRLIEKANGELEEEMVEIMCEGCPMALYASEGSFGGFRRVGHQATPIRRVERRV